MELYYNEIKKLAQGLLDREIMFEIRELFDSYQIIVGCIGCWDAICHRGSWGHEKGLLEVYGLSMEDNDDDDEDPIGYLTAEDILRRIDDLRSLQS